MPSSDLFVVQVLVPGALKNVLPIYYVTNKYVTEFVCSLSTVLNTGTLIPKNGLPVYRYLICL